MNFGEALVVITAIVVGCWLLAQVARYGAGAVRSIFGTSVEGGGASLKESEVETMIRRAVREEVRQELREEVRPLREKIERLERRLPQQQKQPRRDLPEDPHDFGLIAEGGAVREEQAA